MPSLLEAQRDLVKETDSTQPSPAAQMSDNLSALLSLTGISVAGALAVGAVFAGPLSIPLLLPVLLFGFQKKTGFASRLFNLGRLHSDRSSVSVDSPKGVQRIHEEYATLSEDEKLVLKVQLEMLVLATRVFGNEEAALNWLSEPNLATDDNSPMSLLSSNEGFKRVENLLFRIQYGVLS